MFYQQKMAERAEEMGEENECDKKALFTFLSFVLMC